MCSSCSSLVTGDVCSFGPLKKILLAASVAYAMRSDAYTGLFVEKGSAIRGRKSIVIVVG